MFMAKYKTKGKYNRRTFNSFFYRSFVSATTKSIDLLGQNIALLFFHIETRF